MRRCRCNGLSFGVWQRRLSLTKNTYHPSPVSGVAGCGIPGDSGVSVAGLVSGGGGRRWYCRDVVGGGSSAASASGLVASNSCGDGGGGNNARLGSTGFGATNTRAVLRSQTIPRNAENLSDGMLFSLLEGWGPIGYCTVAFCSCAFFERCRISTTIQEIGLPELETSTQDAWQTVKLRLRAATGTSPC